MKINMSGLRSIHALLYTDKMDIYRKVTVTDGDAENNIVPTEPLYSGIECRVSFGRRDSASYAPKAREAVFLRPRIFCDPFTDVLPGDRVVATRYDAKGNVLETFDGLLPLAGFRQRYENHLEFELSLNGDA